MNAPVTITPGRILVLVSTVLLVVDPGCSTKGQERTEGPPTPISGGTLRVLNEPCAYLDPVFVDDAYEGAVINQIYEGLVGLDQNLNVLPALARSWVVSEDGLLYRFTLRQGVCFHDGRPVTPEDVVRSLERGLDPRKSRPCLASTYLEWIDGAGAYEKGKAPRVSGLSVPDRHTVEIRLAEPLSFFLAVLTMDQLKIVPEPLEKPFEGLNHQPDGTGPFRFVRRTDDGSIVLARNQNYWGEPARLDSLIFRTAAGLGPEQVVTRLLHRDVDVVHLSAAQRSLVDRVGGYCVTRCPEIAVTFLGINVRRHPFDRLAVRQAIAMAIDRRGLIDPNGASPDIATGVLPPGLAGYHPEPKVLPRDLDKARALLAEAGFGPAHPLPPLVLFTGTTGSRYLPDALTQQMAAVGIRLQIQRVSWPDLDRALNQGEAGLFTLTWIADVPDPDSFLYFLFRSGQADNFFGFSDAGIDSLLDVGRRMPPGPDRFGVYRRVEAEALRLAPMVPLYHGTRLYAWDPSLEGVEVSPFGISLTRFSKVWFRRLDTAESQNAERIR